MFLERLARSAAGRKNPIRPSLHHELHSRHLFPQPLLDFFSEPYERSFSFSPPPLLAFVASTPPFPSHLPIPSLVVRPLAGFSLQSAAGSLRGGAQRAAALSRQSRMLRAASQSSVRFLPSALFPRFTQKRTEELVCLSHTTKRLHPSSLAACFVAATSLHLQGLFQQAAELYQHVVRQNPHHSLAWGLLGQLYAPFPVST